VRLGNAHGTYRRDNIGNLVSSLRSLATRFVVGVGCTTADPRPISSTPPCVKAHVLCVRSAIARRGIYPWVATVI
jgi:hypothetical protein